MKIRRPCSMPNICMFVWGYMKRGILSYMLLDASVSPPTYDSTEGSRKCSFFTGNNWRHLGGGRCSRIHSSVLLFFELTLDMLQLFLCTREYSHFLISVPGQSWGSLFLPSGSVFLWHFVNCVLLEFSFFWFQFPLQEVRALDVRSMNGA